MSSLSKDLSKSLRDVQPLYETRPRWWQRWTYFIVAVDLLATIGSAELIWRHWTYWEPLPGEVQTKPNADGTEGKKAGHFVLRPWYHRCLAIFLQMAFGAYIGGVLLGTRQRHIRRLFLLPTLVGMGPAATNTPSRSLVIQTLTNFRNRGVVAPLEECALQQGRLPRELSVQVAGLKGPFWIHLESSDTVDGKTLPMGQAKDELFKSWYGEVLGRKLRGEEGWKESP